MPRPAPIALPPSADQSPEPDLEEVAQMFARLGKEDRRLIEDCIDVLLLKERPVTPKPAIFPENCVMLGAALIAYVS